MKSSTELKKKTPFFKKNRPIPLTENESSNYIKKDSIAKAHKAPAYIDSLDREANRFRWRNILGKRIQNSKEDFFYGFSLPPTSFHFNTVQGYNANINFFYNRNWEKKMKSLGIKLYNTFGFSDRENYPGLLLDYLMNRENYSRFYLSAEIGLIQFDDQQPIRLLMNDINSLFFKENFAKWYQNNKIEASFSTFLSPEFLFLFLLLNISEKAGLIQPIFLSLIKS